MAHIVKVFFNCLFKWIRDKNWRIKNTRYYVAYCRYAVKYIIYWKLFRISLHFEIINKYKLNFFHYSIFLSLFENMYLNEEYYVKLPRNPVILDLGSEVGVSVTYFKSIYPNAKILAFEPDPATFKLLIKNIKDNAMKNVIAHNVAVADKVDSLPFYIDSNVDGSLTMSLYPKRQQKKIMVKVDKISRYIKQKIDLLKMDIEGAELAVLADLVRSKKILFVNNMIIEFHHHIDPKINNLSQLLVLLENVGFGYQVQAKYNSPFQKKQYQDFLIFAYKE